MEKQRTVRVFLDEENTPFAEFIPPVKFVLDTKKIPDGKHVLKVIARSSDGVEGKREIPFSVRNGPEIAVVGLNPDDVVDDKIPIILNAYGSERKDVFTITGSETPKAIPSWVWAMIVLFIGFVLFYFIMYLTPPF